MNCTVEPSQLMYIAEKTAKKWARTYDEVDEIQGEILLHLCENVDRINNDAKPARMCWVLAKSKARDLWLVKINRQRITGFMKNIDDVVPSDNARCIVEAEFYLSLVEIIRTAPLDTVYIIKKRIEGHRLDTTEQVRLTRWRKQHKDELKELVA